MSPIRRQAQKSGRARPRPWSAAPSLGELFWGPLANGFRMLAAWRKQRILGKTLKALRRRSMRFEALEPRILLSADLSYAASAAMDATLRIDDVDGASILRLVDNPSSSILVERVIDQNLEVAILGSDQSDRLTIDGLANIISLSFDGGAGTDTLVSDALHSMWLIDGINAGSLAGGASIDFSSVENLTGAADNQDRFVFAGTGGLSGVVEGGAGGFDTVELTGAYDAVVYEVTGADSGIIVLDGQPLVFAGMEPIQFSQAAGTFTYQGTPGGDTIVVKDIADVVDPSFGFVQMEISGTGELVRFANPTQWLIVEGLGGDDAISVESLDPNFRASLRIDGGLNGLLGDEVDIIGDLFALGADVAIEADTIIVRPGVTISTLDTDASGDSVGSSGSIALAGATIDVQAGARLLAHVEGAGAYDPGDVTLTASDSDFTGIPWYDPLFEQVVFPLFGAQGLFINIAEVDVSGATIKGGDVSISATAKYDSESVLGTEIFDGYKLSDLVKLGSQFLFGQNIFSLPFGVLGRIADASVTLDGATLIEASDDVVIQSSGSANGSTTVTNPDFSIGIGLGFARADTMISGTASIKAGGDVLVGSDGEALADVLTRTTTNKDKHQNTISFAFAKTDLVSHATVDQGTTIDAGGIVNVVAKGNSSTSGDAEFAIYKDGTAGVTIGFSWGTSDVEAFVDGTITSAWEAGGTISSPAQRAFALADVDDSAGNETVTLAGHGLGTGDLVIYSSGGADAIGGLADGETYTVLVVDANTVKLTKGPALDINNASVQPGSLHSFALSELFEFDPNGVDIANDTLDLPGHPFSDGDEVVYTSLKNLPIVGLSVGTRYVVDVDGTDPSKIRLKDPDAVRDLRDAGDPDPVANAAPIDLILPLFTLPGTSHGFIYTDIANKRTFAASDPSVVDSLANTFRMSGHGFSTGEVVVYRTDDTVTATKDIAQYHSFDPTRTFTGADDESNLVDYANDRIVLNAANPGDPDPVAGPGLADGDLVVYRTNDGAPIGGLIDGTTYVVLNADGRSVQLAELSTPTIPIALSQAGGTGDLHQLISTRMVQVDDPAITGLEDGGSYYVSVIDADTFRLANSLEEARMAAPIDLVEAAAMGNDAHSLDVGLTEGIGIRAELTSKEGSSAASGIGGDPSLTDYLLKKELARKAIVDSVNKLIKPAQTGSGASGSGAATSNYSLAGAVAFSFSDHDVTAKTGDNAVLKSRNDVEVIATQTAKFQQAAEASIEKPDDDPATGVLSAGISVGLYNNSVEAVIDGSTIDARHDLLVDSSVAYPFLTNPTFKDLFLQDELGDNFKPSNIGDLLDGTLGLQGKLFNTWTRSVAGGDKAPKFAVAGSVTYLQVDTASRAFITGGAQINQGVDPVYQSASQSVSLDASTEMQLVNLAGVFDISLDESGLKDLVKKKDPFALLNPFGAEGGKGGVGGAVFLGFIDNDTIARIGDADVRVGATGTLDVVATTDIVQFNLVQSGASAETFGLSATFAWNDIDNQTLARIDNRARIVGGTVTVDAVDETNSFNIGGGIVKGESIGVGVTIGVNAIDRATHAIIGNGPDNRGGPWVVTFNNPGDQPGQFSAGGTPSFDGTPSFTTLTEGATNAKEVQTISHDAILGNVQFTFEGETTGFVPALAPGFLVESELNNLASIQAAGGVTVTGGLGDPWRVEFLQDGDRSPIAARGDADFENPLLSPVLGLFDPTVETTRTRLGIPGVVRDVQTISHDASAGNLRFHFGLLETTNFVPFDAPAGDVQAELDNLPSIQAAGGVIVEGGNGQPWVIRFNANGPQLPILGEGDAAFNATGIDVVTAQDGAVDTQEVQEVSHDATEGAFTLSFQGNKTGPLAHDVSAAEVEAALEALDGIDGVTVTGGAGGPWQVVFDDPGDQGQIVAEGVKGFDGQVTVAVMDGSAGIREVQTIDHDGLGGSFTLSLDGGMTKTQPLRHDATPQEIEDALNALPAVQAAGGVTVATLSGGGRVDADGDVTLSASAEGNVKSFSLAASFVKEDTSNKFTPPAGGVPLPGLAREPDQPNKNGIAFAGDLAINDVDDVVEAYINNGSDVSGQSVLLNSQNHTSLITGTGALAISLSGDQHSIGIAGAFSWNDVDGRTRAFVADAQVHQQGAFAGSLTAAAVDDANDTIDFGAPHGLATGTLLIYRRNGGASTDIQDGSGNIIGSLEDGKAYYVVALDPQTIRLAATFDDAMAGDFLRITPSAGVGMQSLSQDLSLSADRKGDLFALAAGGAGAPTKKGVAVAGSVSVNLVDNETEAFLSNAGATLGGGALLNAQDTTEMSVISGGVSFGGKAAVGAAFAVNLINNETSSRIEGSTLDHQGDLDLAARNASTMGVIAGAGGVSYGKLGLAGSVAVNLIDNTTSAVILDSSNAGSAAPGAVSLSAQDDSTIRTVAGGVAVSGNAAIGLAVAVNDIGNATRAIIDDSPVVAGGTVALAADSNSKIEALSFGAALSVAAGSGKQVSGSGTGAVSVNTIGNVIEAVIRDSDTADVETVQAGGGASLTATDDSSITARAIAGSLSVAASGSTAGSGSVGVGVAHNIIGNQARAAIDGVDVTSSAGNVSLDASSTSVIDAVAVAASVGFSGSSTNAISISADVSFAKNEIGNTVEAVITGGSSVQTPGAVSLSATDDSAITTDVVSVSVSAAFGSSASGGLAVAGTIALNDVANVTRAAVEGSTVGAGTTLVATALSSSTIDAVGVAASAQITGSGSLALSGAGTGADVDNSITNTIQAGITGDSGVTAGGALTISATDEATISGVVVAASASVAAGSTGALSLSIAVALADNTIDNKTRALIDDSSVAAGGSVTLTADSTTDIDVTGVAAALSVAASSGSLALGTSVTVAVVNNTVDGVVEAMISDADAADLQSVTAGGPITILASNGSDIDALTGSVATTISATSGSVAIGANIAVALAGNAVGTNVTAGIRNSVVGTSLGGVDIDALSNTTVDAVTFAASVGISGSSSVAGSFSGAGARASNTITGTTLAAIEAGSDVDAPGDITVDAADTSSITSHVVSGSVSVGGSGTVALAVGISVTLAENTIAGTTSALIADSDVDSSAGSIILSASGTNTIDAVAVAASASIAGSGTFSLAGAGSGASATNTTTNAITALISNGTVDAAGSLSVTASDTSSITSDVVSASASIAASGSAALSISIAVALAENSIGGTTLASIDGSTVTSNGVVTVAATADNTIDALGAAVGVSISGSGSFALSGAGTGASVGATTTNTVEASITNGSMVTAGGDVTLSATDLSDIDSTVVAASFAASGSGSAAISLTLAVSIADSQFGTVVRSAIVDSDVTSTGGSVLLTALSDGSIKALSTGVGISVGGSGAFSLNASGAGAIATIRATNVTEAVIIGDSNVTAHGGSVTLMATDDTLIDTDVVATGVSGGGAGAVSVNVALSVAEATTDVTSAVHAKIDDSDVSASGDVTVQADATGTVDTLGVGVSVAVGGAGTVGVSGAGAAASTANSIATAVEALITGSDLAEGQDVTAGGNVTVLATDDLTVSADTKAASAAITGGTVAVSVAIAGAVATNSATGSTRAGIRNSLVDANGGDVQVRAESTSGLEARPDAVAIGVAIGIGTSASGSGAVARNTNDSMIEAVVSDASTLEASGAITIEALDNSDATASIVSVALTGGLTGAAVGIGVTETSMANATSAAIDGSSATAQGGPIQVKAGATQDIEARATVVSVAIAIGGAGAGADASTNIDSTVEAYARNATLTATGSSVFIDADSDHTANAVSQGGAAGVVAVSAMFADASIGGATRAFADGAVTVDANELQVTADSTANAMPDALSASISSVGGAGAVVSGTVDRTTEAYVGTRAGQAPSGPTVLSVPDGDVVIAATSVFLADASPLSLGIGAASVGVALTDATINGVTRAYVGEATTVNAGELDVLATSTETAIADTIVLAVGLSAGVAAATSDAAIDSAIEAWIGTRPGDVPSAGTETNVTITAGGTGDGSVTVDADAIRTADADAKGLAGSFAAVSVSVMLPTATIGGGVLAGINGDVDLFAATVDVTAGADNLADANALVASISIGGLGGAGANAVAEILDSADVEAIVGSGVVIAAVGSVTVDARHQGTNKNRAGAQAIGGAGGLLGGAAVMLADAKVGGGVKAVFDGELASASQLTVEADGRNLADTDTLAVGLGAFGGSGSGALAEVTDQADVVASVGSTASITTTGALLVKATADNDATVESDAGSGGIVGIAGSALTAKVGGATKGELGGDVHSALSVDVEALADNNADAEALAIAFGLYAGAGVAPSALITHEAIVEASIGADSALTLPGVLVDVLANSINTAAARSTGVSAGIGNIQVMAVNADIGGATRAFVDRGAGIAAGSVDVDASATDTATATVTSVGVGLASGAGASVSASDLHTVEAFIGPALGSASAGAPTSVTTSGDINVDARVTSVADANGNLTSVGIGGAGAFAVTTATASPTVRAYLGDMADVTAGGNLTIRADADADATADGGGVGVGLGAFTGSQSTAIASPIVSAFTGSGASVSANGIVTIVATSSNTAIADAAGTSVGGIAAGTNFADARIDGSTRAYVAGNAGGSSGTISGSSVTINALSDDIATATAKGLAAGVLAGAGADAEALVSSDVEAYAGLNADIAAITGDIVIDAASIASANAVASGVSGGAVGIGVSKSRATIDSDVEARVDRFATLDAADDIFVRGRHNMSPDGIADQTKRATSTASASGGGALSGNGAEAIARSSTDAKAFVNTAASLNAQADINIQAFANNDARADGDGSSLGFAGIGGVNVDAMIGGLTEVRVFGDAGGGVAVDRLNAGSEISVRAIDRSYGLAVGEAAAGGVISGPGADVDSVVSRTVRALVGNDANADIDAGGDVFVHADGSISSRADATGRSAGIYSAGASSANATTTATVTAGIEDTAVVDAGGSIVIDADLQPAANGHSAYAAATSSSGSLIGGVGASAAANAIGTAKASVGNGARLTTLHGDIDVDAHAVNSVFARTIGDSIGLVTGGRTDADGFVTTTSTALVESGAVLSAGNHLKLASIADSRADVESRGGTGAVAGGNVSDVLVDVTGNALTQIDDHADLSAKFDVYLTADNKYFVRADAFMQANGIVASVTTANTVVRVDGNARVVVGQNVGIAGNTVTIDARNSLDVIGNSDARTDVPIAGAFSNADTDVDVNNLAATITVAAGSDIEGEAQLILNALNQEVGQGLQSLARSRADTGIVATATADANGSVETDAQITTALTSTLTSNDLTVQTDSQVSMDRVPDSVAEGVATKTLRVVTNVVKKVTKWLPWPLNKVVEWVVEKVVTFVTVFEFASAHANVSGTDDNRDDVIRLDGDIVLGGAPSRTLIVNADGTVHPASDLGALIDANSVLVDDVMNNATGRASFRADNGVVSGAATIFVPKVLADVRIENYSDRDLLIQGIDLVSGNAGDPDLSVSDKNSVVGVDDTPFNIVNFGGDGSRVSIINHSSDPDADIVFTRKLDDENVLALYYIQADGGDILQQDAGDTIRVGDVGGMNNATATPISFAATGDALLDGYNLNFANRLNAVIGETVSIYLLADNGQIGSSTTPFRVEMLRGKDFPDGSLATTPVTLKAVAHGDIFLTASAENSRFTNVDPSLNADRVQLDLTSTHGDIQLSGTAGSLLQPVSSQVVAAVELTGTPTLVFSDGITTLTGNPVLTFADNLLAAQGAPTVTFDATAELSGMPLLAFSGVISQSGTPMIDFQNNGSIVRGDSGSWFADGFLPGQTITISGSASNDGSYQIATVGSSTLTLTSTAMLIEELGVAGVTVSTPRANARITRDAGTWFDDGFRAGQTITVSNAGANDGTFTVEDVNGTILTLISGDTVVEATGIAGASIDADRLQPIVTRAIGSWLDDGFRAGQTITVTNAGANDGVYTLAAVDATTLTLDAGSAIGNAADVAGATITADRGEHLIERAAGSWFADGFVIGQSITVSGTAFNDGTFTIGSLTADTITLQSGETVTDETAAGASLSSAQGDVTIERDSGSWIAEGFAIGQEITINGAGSNDGQFFVDDVTDTALTLTPGSVLNDATIDLSATLVTISADAQQVVSEGIALQATTTLAIYDILRATAELGDVTIDVTGDLNVSDVSAVGGTARLTASRGIMDRDNDSGPEVSARTIRIEASNGGIGSLLNSFDIDSSNNSPGTVTVVAAQSIYVTEAVGDMQVDNVVSLLGDVTLGAQGSILDGVMDSGATDVSGRNVSLLAVTGSIGVSSDPLEVNTDSAGGGKLTLAAATGAFVTEASVDVILSAAINSTSTVVLVSPGRILDGDDDGSLDIVAPGVVFIAAGGIGTSTNPIDTQIANLEAQAGGGIWIRNSGALTIGGSTPVEGLSADGEIVVTAQSPLAVAEDVIASGNITLTAVDSSATGDDLAVMNAAVVRSTGGSVDLRAGDDLTLAAGSSVQAAGAVNLRGDYGNADAGTGSVITVQGQVIANLFEASGDTDVDTLVGADQVNAWNITGTNSGDLNGSLHFAAIESLTGGAQDDTFYFIGGGNVTGVIDGASEQTVDVLDYIRSDFLQEAAINYQQVTLPIGDGVVPFTATGGIVRIEEIRVIVLAEVLADGTLELNIGPRAPLRLAINTVDGDEVFTVHHVSGDPDSADGETVAVTAFDITLEYAGVKRIRGVAGDGNDHVTIAESVRAPVTLWGDHPGLMAGAPGDDVLEALGTGKAVLHGGFGNDTLMGGASGDELIGGPGDDHLDGGDGNDVLLGDAGVVAGSSVLLTEVAEVVGELPLDAWTGGAASEETVRALLEADLVLLVGRTDAAGCEDDRALLLELAADGDDELWGGEGDDALFGQGGNDVLQGEGGRDLVAGGAGDDEIDGGTGDDTLVGDELTVDSAAAGVLNVARGLSIGGNVVLPAVRLVPGATLDAFTSVLPAVSGYGAGQLLAAEDGGPGFQAYASLVTGFGHHLDQVRGNDVLRGGEGNDRLVGDDQVVFARSLELDIETMGRAEALTRGLLEAADDLSDLVHRQYRLLDDHGHRHHHHHYDGEVTVVDNVFTVGADTLDGGAGNDVLIGDDSVLIAHSLTLPVGLAGEFERFAEGMAEVAHELTHVVQDLADLDRHLREEVIEVPYKRKWVREVLERHVDLVEMGNDTLLGGDGNDLIVGDTFLMRTAEVTLVPGGWGFHWGKLAHRHDHHDHHHQDHDDWGGKRGADVISGGAGNDVIFGDSVALVTSTVSRGEGLGWKDFRRAQGDAQDALEAIISLTDWLAPRGGEHHRHQHHGKHAHFDNGDHISGGEGDDILFGQDGNDTLRGDAGSDWLVGGNGKDKLDGGPGRDKSTSGSENSSSLRSKVGARMIDWSNAFGDHGLTQPPFAGLTLAKGGQSNFVSFAFLSYDRPKSSWWDDDRPAWPGVE